MAFVHVHNKIQNEDNAMLELVAIRLKILNAIYP